MENPAHRERKKEATGVKMDTDRGSRTSFTFFFFLTPQSGHEKKVWKSRTREEEKRSPYDDSALCSLAYCRHVQYSEFLFNQSDFFSNVFIRLVAEHALRSNVEVTHACDRIKMTYERMRIQVLVRNIATNRLW